ncbi:hypothetical protein [Maribacter sp. 2-571]|uniref:hypothetical protein n=1 Tax=Maribacter sp. 2-571 TaxID=3417569 RepID=UPI003D32785D
MTNDNNAYIIMGYLSPQIAAFAKKSKQKNLSLIKKQNSCGIFQDYEAADNKASDKSEGDKG